MTEKNQTANTQQMTSDAQWTATVLAAINQASTAAGAVGSDAVYLGTKKSKIPATIALPGRTEQEVPDVVTTQQAIAMYLNDPKKQAAWRKTMQRYGLETGNALLERRAFETAVLGASDWFITSNKEQKVTPEQYLAWYAGGSKKKPAVPTRQVYAATPEQIDADINTIATKTLGREIQDADKEADWYQDLVKGINKLYSKGTVTTVEQVKNPKTGKMEKVVKQTPGFSKEQITEKITGAVEAADPESLARKERIDFTKWMFGRGGQG